MGGAGFSLALLLVALVPVFAHAAEAGEAPEDDGGTPADRRKADPDGGVEDWSWPSWTPAPQVIA